MYLGIVLCTNITINTTTTTATTYCSKHFLLKTHNQLNHSKDFIIWFSRRLYLFTLAFCTIHRHKQLPGVYTAVTLHLIQ